MNSKNVCEFESLSANAFARSALAREGVRRKVIFYKTVFVNVSVFFAKTLLVKNNLQ